MNLIEKKKSVQKKKTESGKTETARGWKLKFSEEKRKLWKIVFSAQLSVIKTMLTNY